MKDQKSLSEDAAQLRAFEHLFLTWLYNSNLYCDFVSCLRSAGYTKSLQSYVARFFNNPSRPPFSIITSAFDWLDTPQGFCFWRKASDSWKFYLGRFIKSLK